MPAPAIAIIGGGWAGLAAAVTLADHGVPATLYESAAQLGGRARRVKCDGRTLDNGQHILLGAYHDTLRLLRRVGVDPRRAFYNSPLQLHASPNFYLRAAPLPAPWHLGLGLVTARGFTWRDKLATLHLLRGLRQARFRVASTTVEALLKEYRQTPASCDYLWRPLCLAALNTAPEHADAQIFVNVLRDSFFGSRAASELLLPRMDLGQLFPDAAEIFLRQRGIKIYLQHAVQRVTPLADGLAVSTERETQNFSQVICALPPYRVPAILSACTALANTMAALATYVYEPIYTVYLQYTQTVSLKYPMQGMSGDAGQWVFDRGALGGPAGLLAVVISARGPHQSLDHARLAQRCALALSAQFGIAEVPHWTQVIAEKRATFSCIPGLYRPSHQTAQAGLFLAGDYAASEYPATLETAVRSGIQCALKILESRT